VDSATLLIYIKLPLGDMSAKFNATLIWILLSPIAFHIFVKNWIDIIRGRINETIIR
jgi:hypothetical protein